PSGCTAPSGSVRSRPSTGPSMSDRVPRTRPRTRSGLGCDPAPPTMRGPDRGGPGRPTRGCTVAQDVYQHTLTNGLVLLAERMTHVRSAAFNFLVPAGCAYDPPGRLGIASVLAEMITRGAGERD